MGTTATLVTLDEYLNTSYEPDMDFVDGVLVSRNVGTKAHGLLQTLVIAYFFQFRQSHSIEVYTETRLRVDAKTGRHRIPDVMVVPTPIRKGKVVLDVPAVIVEIKSRDDTFDDIVDRCFDYEKLGVPNILVMDPDHRRIWVFEGGDLRHSDGEAVSLRLGASTLDFPFGTILGDLEKTESSYS